MKHRSVVAALLGLWAAGAVAVDLNTDALKKIQEEGHKIVEDEQNYGPFTLQNGKCLQAAGNPDKKGVKLVIRKCDSKANNQKWQLKQNQLLSRGGLCVGVAGQPGQPGRPVALQPCDNAKHQRWSLDGANRLANGLGHCLQATDGDMVTAACDDSAVQKWR